MSRSSQVRHATAHHAMQTSAIGPSSPPFSILHTMLLPRLAELLRSFSSHFGFPVDQSLAGRDASSASACRALCSTARSSATACRHCRLLGGLPQTPQCFKSCTAHDASIAELSLRCQKRSA